MYLFSCCLMCLGIWHSTGNPFLHATLCYVCDGINLVAAELCSIDCSAAVSERVRFYETRYSAPAYTGQAWEDYTHTHTHCLKVDVLNEVIGQLEISQHWNSHVLICLN